MLLTRPPLPLLAVRLACVKHAASVRSEPGSNSQVHHVPVPEETKTKRTNPVVPDGSKIQVIADPEFTSQA